MRNPSRLDGFYDELKTIHKTLFPDWRFGQLCWNIIYWLINYKNVDPFFVEEDDMIKYINEFTASFKKEGDSQS